MMKSGLLLGVPLALGLGAMIDPDGSNRPGQAILHNAFVVEMGLAFPEAAVRAALPPGLEPARGFTGGIALHAAEEGWGFAPLAGGYLWIDLAAAEGEREARFLLHALSADADHAWTRHDADGSPIPVGFAEPPQGAVGAILAVTAEEGRGSISLAVLADPAGCDTGLAAMPPRVLAGAAEGGVADLHPPVTLDPCAAEPLAIGLDLAADHPLAPFAEARPLWASVATPLRWAMPEGAWR